MSEHRVSAKLKKPVGFAEVAPVFDKQPNEPCPDIELLTIIEAADLLTVSVSVMRRLQQARRIPFFKVSGSIRFAKSDLVSYLARQRIGSVGEYR